MNWLTFLAMWQAGGLVWLSASIWLSGSVGKPYTPTPVEIFLCGPLVWLMAWLGDVWER
jgi:hypothetical protein